MRFHLTVEYDGGAFVGWQRQKNGISVQEAIESAIRKFCGQEVTAHGAGRTDAGVHALGQAVHFDLDGPYQPETVRKAINYHLGNHLISVVRAREVPDDFSVRFSAVQRHYEYRIINRRAPLTHEHGHAWLLPRALDIDAMAAAAGHLIGKHDFTTFRSIRCQAKSPVKTLDTLEVSKDGDRIFVRASARSYLHSQIRSMVGSLVKVGEGHWPALQVQTILEAVDRTLCGPVAPAEGLFLIRVDYPEI